MVRDLQRSSYRAGYTEGEEIHNKRWEDKITECSGLRLGRDIQKAENRRVDNSGCHIILGAPSHLD